MDPVVGVIVAAFAGFAGAIVPARWTSRVAARATDNTALLEWAKQLHLSEKEAREDREAVRDQVDDLTEKLRAAQRMADRLTDTLASVQAEVWRPEPDVAALRRLVGRPVNGADRWPTT